MADCLDLDLPQEHRQSQNAGQRGATMLPSTGLHSKPSCCCSGTRRPSDAHRATGRRSWWSKKAATYFTPSPSVHRRPRSCSQRQGPAYIRLRDFPSHLSYRYESFNFRPTGRLTFDQRAHSSRAVQTPNGALAVCGTVHFDTAHRVQRPRLYAVCPCTCACTSPRVSRSVRRTPARGVAAPASPRSERRLRCNETCKRCTVYAAASSIVLLAFLRCSRRSLPL